MNGFMGMENTRFHRVAHGNGARAAAEKVVIRFAVRDEARALPVLLRHSPAMVLPERTYVVSVEAARTLQERGVKFTLLCSQASDPGSGGPSPGERI